MTEGLPELALPLISHYMYPIYELLEYMKEPVLLNQSCRISMTPGNSRLSKRSLGEGPVLPV